jgi:hypothetical protein
MPMNPRLLRPGVAFTPRNISSIALWLDASDSASITTATGVSEWRDKSGNGRNFTQTTENNQPALTANARNGRAVLTFDGTNDSLSGPAGFSLTSTHSVFAVVNPTVRKIAAIISGSVNTEFTYGDGSSSFSGSKFAVFGVARAVYGGGTITTAAYQVVSVVCSGGTLPSNLSMWTNGAGGPVSTETAGTAPVAAITAPITIGTLLGSQFWNGVIAEVVIYGRTLSTADRQSVERWLGRKWGISVA